MLQIPPAGSLAPSSGPAPKIRLSRAPAIWHRLVVKFPDEVSVGPRSLNRSAKCQTQLASIGRLSAKGDDRHTVPIAWLLRGNFRGNE
jgi:hypothetical protein